MPKRVQKEKVVVSREKPAPIVRIKKKWWRELLSSLNPFQYLFPRKPVLPRPWLSAVPTLVQVHGEILDRYLVRATGTEAEYPAAIHITREGGKGYYLVNEPELTKEESEVFRLIMEEVTRSIRTEETIIGSLEQIQGVAWRAARDLGLLDVTRDSMAKFVYYMAKNLMGFWHIHPAMLDPGVEEISVTGAGKPAMIIHRRFTDLGWLESNMRFVTEEELSLFCRRLAQMGGKSLSAAAPIAEFTISASTYQRATGSTFPTSFRVAATLGGEVGESSSFTIRRHMLEPLTLPFLVHNGTLSPLLGAYLWTLVAEKGPLVILGGVGSGKTTLLNALCLCIPPNRSIVTLEDTREIYIPHPNWLALHTRVGYSFTETRFDIDLFDLAKHVLRRRPDYVVVGETRGKEIQSLVHAFSIGHGGITTFHANSLEEAKMRWTSPPMELPESSLSLFWSCAIVRAVNLRGRMVRRVAEVWEVPPGAAFRPYLLFRWDPRSDSFSPDSAREVARRSTRLRASYEAKGLEETELVQDLRRREKVLEEMAEEGKIKLEHFRAALV